MNLHEVPLHRIRGVGERKAVELEALGIRSVADLLEHFPYRYEDYRLRDVAEAKDGEKITVQGTVFSAPVLQRYGGKSRLSCKLLTGRVLVTAVWFNRPFLKDRLVSGRVVTVSGKWDQRRLQITVAQSEFADSGSSMAGTLQPVYSVGGDITQAWLRKTIRQALDQFGEHVEELLPEELIRRHRLMSRREAIRGIHLPSETSQFHEARRRLVYEELFLFQLKLQAYRSMTRSRADGIAQPLDREAVRAFARSLPFRLTGAQKRAIADILNDMESPYAMNRLLQGDVGSGKTVVAATALFATVKAGYQGVLMAPTEILAEQHLRSLERLFAPYGLQIALLTGSMTERQRRDTLAALQMGLLDVVVGTHALIQDDVYFARLGLVITDEQHRFGVNQRAILRRKGWNPDVLSMTATPIPRTLAITAFGDLDVSTLDELPQGRKPVRTHWVKPNMMDRVVALLRKELAQGRQGYVICPLIEESDKLDVQNAIDLHGELARALPEFRVGLLHGRMSAAEKEAAMRSFQHNETQLLVSTTVVEVGVDVPNATVMVVVDADRFGLSQLHQLRGRVGRGEHESVCVLIADPKSETGRERMRVMTETNDGFEIARKDLELRGPGDFFGTKQSGLPDFRLADLNEDFAVLEQARDDAAELVRKPDFRTAAAYVPLREYLARENVLGGDVLD
jgi:ATP-dependent DNA helicase RecG